MTQGILDFSKEFDVSLMDRVVMAFYSGAGREVRHIFAGTRVPWHLMSSVYSNNWRSKF